MIRKKKGSKPTHYVFNYASETKKIPADLKHVFFAPSEVW